MPSRSPNKIPTWKVEKYLRLLVGEGKNIGILQEFRWKKQLTWPIAAFWMACRIFFFILWAVINLDRSHHRLRTPRENFFSKIPNFWAWVNILGFNFLRHLGCFWPNFISALLWNCESLVHGKMYLVVFPTKKTLVFRPNTYKSQINSKYDIGHK